MPNPVPQSRIPNRNEGATQTQGKNAPKQASKKTQLLTAKSASPKDATKRIEHFDGNPTKKNTSGRQMPAGRREQMDREISLFVQAVFESFVRDAQSKGGNPAGNLHPEPSLFQPQMPSMTGATPLRPS